MLHFQRTITLVSYIGPYNLLEPEEAAICKIVRVCFICIKMSLKLSIKKIEINKDLWIAKKKVHITNVKQRLSEKSRAKFNAN